MKQNLTRCINCKLTEEEYQRIRYQVERLGLSSMYEYFRGLIRLNLLWLESRQQMEENRDVDMIHADIDEMFSEMSDAEAFEINPTKKYRAKTWNIDGNWEYFGTGQNTRNLKHQHEDEEQRVPSYDPFDAMEAFEDGEAEDAADV